MHTWTLSLGQRLPFDGGRCGLVAKGGEGEVKARFNQIFRRERTVVNTQMIGIHLILLHGHRRWWRRRRGFAHVGILVTHVRVVVDRRRLALARLVVGVVRVILLRGGGRNEGLLINYEPVMFGGLTLHPIRLKCHALLH